MAKDPALLWYFNDWHGGTSTMSRFLKGCYMDLLHAQFNNGHLSLDEIKVVLGSDFGSSWPTLQKKLMVDDKGLYYNPRLEAEHSKRKTFSASRVENLKGSKKEKILGTHMENENESTNEVKNEIKGVQGDESSKPQGQQFESMVAQFERFWGIYDKKVGRFDCEKLWVRISEADRVKIMDYVPKYVASTPDKGFRKNPETFLRNEGWRDEIIINTPTKTTVKIMDGKKDFSKVA